MIKRKGGSQIENFTSNHKSFESKDQMKFDWGMLYTIVKIYLKDISLFWENYERPKFWDNKS